MRERAVAFARKQRDGDGGDKDSGKHQAAEPKPDPETTEIADATTSTTNAKLDAVPDETMTSSAETQPIATRRSDELPTIDPPTPKAEPWPDATPPPMKPVEPADPSRLRTSTVAMPVHQLDLGRPPEMPRTTAPPPLVLGSVEDPTHMPSPREIPSGSPDDPAPAPGMVPPGDSRSLRRETDFALIYRVGTCVITRTGSVGTRGQWRVVEYPTSAAASNSYAKECSRFVSEGFSDYRD